MDVNDDIDQRLADIARRLEAKRAQVRSHLETRPALQLWLEEARSTLGARLTFLEVDHFTDGDPERIYEIDGQPGYVVRNPAPYHPPQAARRGKAARMRARESSDAKK